MTSSTQPSAQPSAYPTMVPSSQPSSQPSITPTLQPSTKPSSQPSRQPTNFPTRQPSQQPSNYPSCHPTNIPSSQPSLQPSLQPSDQPLSYPTSQPSKSPTLMPSAQPTSNPSVQPTDDPSVQPTLEPSSSPSMQPSMQPSNLPSIQPSSKPTVQPTAQPTWQPSIQPSTFPTLHPSSQPSLTPSDQPSSQPTIRPSVQPSLQPTSEPTRQPSSQPTIQPTSSPTIQPSSQPTVQPTRDPSAQPSRQPTRQPTKQPSNCPSTQPSRQPTSQPSTIPSIQPTCQPSMKPTEQPSNRPSFHPTSQPSTQPSISPTKQPSRQPSSQPSAVPSMQPVRQPSMQPTTQPSRQPSTQPSKQPSTQPSSRPSSQPSRQPTQQPTVIPSTQPTRQPTVQPSTQPSIQPTMQPSRQPSKQPTSRPSSKPSEQPTRQPSTIPSMQPTMQPSIKPTIQPSRQPTNQPSRQPSIQPSNRPTSQPSQQPTFQPSAVPSVKPTRQPSTQPSIVPSTQPTIQPSMQPSKQPTSRPSFHPSEQPTRQPSTIPSMQPTMQPSIKPTIQPSIQPTTRPSIQPSQQPFTRPSTQPSSQPTNPTGQPSSQPTVRPTTSQPTGVPSAGPTAHKSFNLPSNCPSSAPSYDLDYSRDATYQYYLKSKAAYASIPDSFSFGTFYYKGLTVDGSATAWQSLTDNVLYLPFDYAGFTTLTFDSRYVNFNTLKQQSNIYTCTNAGVVRSIINSLQTKVVYAGDCDGNQWRVFQCESNVLCVNCKLNCVKTVSCPGTGSVINPAASCKTHASASALLSAQYAFIKYYPKISLPLQTQVNRTSVRVQFNVTSIGNVYCAALPTGSTIASVLDIREAAVSEMALSDQVSIEIPGLGPDTDYDVYCYSEDFSSHVMTLDDALSTKTTIHTLCCSSIRVLKTYSIIYQYVTNGRPESRFMIELDSKPTGVTRVSLALTEISCIDSSPVSTPLDASILPSSFAFDSTSTDLRGSFVVRAIKVGCYRISITIIGTKSYYGSEISFIAANYRGVPRVPVLIDASISTQASSLLLDFDSATDQASSFIADYAGPFLCSKIVLFKGSSDFECRWLSPSQLEATPSGSMSLPNVGDQVQLLGSLLRAQCVPYTACSSYKFVEGTIIKISPPANPLKPTALLSASSKVISHCDDIMLDPTMSFGYGGRSWRSVVWLATGLGIAESADDITKYLNANYPDTYHLVRIPNTNLTQSTRNQVSQYTISLTVTNFLMQSSTSSVTIEVGSSRGLTYLQVQISGAQVSTFTWMSLTLLGSAQFPACVDSAASSLSLNYIWRVYKGFQFQSSIVSTSLDPHYFKLDPYTLDAASMYTVSLSVSVQSGSKVYRSYASGVIQVGRSGVSAVIKGSSFRTVISSNAVVLDASSSTDIDYPAEASTLTYIWSCSVLSPYYGSSCSKFVTSGSSILTLGSDTLTAGYNYSISVTVSNSVGKYDTASVELSVVADAVPYVNINSVKDKYNAGDKIILVGSIQADTGDAAAEWMSSTVFASPSSVFLTATTRIFSQGQSMFQLAIAPYSLAAGLTYTFRLQSHYIVDASLSGVSAVNVVMNGPPRGGVVEIDPTRGTALETVFALTTYRWSDDSSDLPLSYVMSYYTIDPSNLNLIKSLDGTPYVTTYLGQGLFALNYQITCVADARDIHGCSANQSTVAIVRPYGSAISKSKSRSALDLSSAIVSTAQSLLNSAFNQQNPTAVIQAISATSLSINAAVCSAVPVSCSTINRQVCSRTDNTCGPCLDGYIGVYGDSNIACQQTDALKPIGASCSANKMCITGLCSHGECQDVVKSCPGNCNGKGSCLFYDLKGNRVDNCTLVDESCTAQCNCIPRNFGDSCSLSRSNFKNNVFIRESLCSSLYDTLQLQDISSDVLEARALIISRILIDSTQLTDSAVQYCAVALVETISSYPLLACQGSSLRLVVSAISKILEAVNNLSSALFLDVLTALEILGAGCQNNLAVGEAPTEIMTDSVRFLTALGDKDTMHGQSLLIPQSSFQAFNHIPAPQLSPNFSSCDSMDSKGITAFVLSNSPTSNIATNSSQVNINVINYQRDLSSAKYSISTGAEILLTLINEEPINYWHISKYNTTVECAQYLSEAYFTYVTCSNGQHYRVICPANAKGVVAVTCPHYETAPQCTSRPSGSSTKYEVDESCAVVDFNPFNTTCRCGLRADQRHLTEQQSNARAYSSTLVVTSNIVETVFEAQPTLTKAQRNDAIIAGLSLIIGLFVVGLIYILAFVESEQSNTAAKSKDNFKTRAINHFYDSIFPDELRVASWHLTLWNQLQSEHCIISLFYSSKHRYIGKPCQWACFTCRLFTILFSSSLVATIIYADDGYCEDLTSEEHCTSATRMRSIVEVCHWRSDNESCEYHSPHLNYEFIVILMLIVSMLTVPLDKVLSYLIRMCCQFIHYRQLKSQVQPSEELPASKSMLSHRFDEFYLSQTLKSTILRAARLEKAHKMMDFLQPSEEALILSSSKLDEARMMDMFSSFFHVSAAFNIREHWLRKKYGGFNHLTNLTYAQLRYGLALEDLKNVESLAKNIESVRSRSTNMREEIELLTTAEEREEFLMRHFIVDCLCESHQRATATKYFLRDYNASRTDNVIIQELCCIVLLPIVLTLMIFFLSRFNLSVGSRATNLWILVTCLVIVQDLLVLEPLKILLNWWIITRSVAADARELVERLCLRSKLVMMRTTGLMRDADALVQHFNPACRVARMYPQLPISRLLMSINDFDIPERTVYGSVDYGSVDRLQFFCSNGIVFIAFLPEILQQVVLDALSSGLIALVLLGLKALGSFSVIAAVFTVIGFIFLVALWEVYMNWKDRREYIKRNTIRRTVFMGANIDVGLGTDLNLSERRDLNNKFHVIRSLQAVLHASKYGLTSPEKYALSVSSFVQESSNDEGLERILNEQLYDYESVWGLQNDHAILILGRSEEGLMNQFGFDQGAREKRAKPKQYITKVFPVDINEDTSIDASLNVPTFNNLQDDLKMKFSLDDNDVYKSNDYGSFLSQNIDPRKNSSKVVFSPMSSESPRNHLTIDDFVESNYRNSADIAVASRPFKVDLSSPPQRMSIDDLQNRAGLPVSNALFTTSLPYSTPAQLVSSSTTDMVPLQGKAADDDIESDDLSSDTSNMDDFLKSALFLDIRNRATVARHSSSMEKSTNGVRHNRHKHDSKTVEIIFQTDESKTTIDQVLDELDLPSLTSYQPPLQSNYGSPYRSPSLKGMGISNTKKVRSKVQIGTSNLISDASPISVDGKYGKDDSADSISTVSYRSRLRYAKEKMRGLPEERVAPSQDQDVRNRSDSAVGVNQLVSINHLSQNSMVSSPSSPDPVIPFVSRNRRHRSTRYVHDMGLSTPRGPGTQQQATAHTHHSQEDMRFPMLLDDSSESSINFPRFH